MPQHQKDNAAGCIRKTMGRDGLLVFYYERITQALVWSRAIVTDLWSSLFSWQIRILSHTIISFFSYIHNYVFENSKWKLPATLWKGYRPKSQQWKIRRAKNLVKLHWHFSKGEQNFFSPFCKVLGMLLTKKAASQQETGSLRAMRPHLSCSLPLQMHLWRPGGFYICNATKRMPTIYRILHCFRGKGTVSQE